MNRCKLYFLHKTRQPIRQLQHQMNGGAERDRTADPLLAKQVLSQLSYSPNLLSVHAPKALHGGGASAPTALGLAKALRLPVRDRNEPGSTNPTVNHQTGAELHVPHGTARPERSGQRPRQRQDKKMVGPGRLELPTPRLSSVCSNQLSYGPIRVEQHCSTDPAKAMKPDQDQRLKAWSLSFRERET